MQTKLMKPESNGVQKITIVFRATLNHFIWKSVNRFQIIKKNIECNIAKNVYKGVKNGTSELKTSSTKREEKHARGIKNKWLNPFNMNV